MKNEIRKKQLAFLESEERKNPLLFRKETFVDSPEFLKKFGIFINDKKNFPLGYIKLWPQDFIVEEIDNHGRLQNIDTYENNKITGYGKTIFATLVKCGISTLEAVEELSDLLNIDKKYIRFSGIKDKDAITSQLISIQKSNIEKIRSIESPNLFLKNIHFGKGIVEMGGLKSNQFTILIRTNKNSSKEGILNNLKKISKEGFLNFFYLQRFGTPRLINFRWGFSILKGDYKKAVFDFLSSPGERENPYFINIRNEIKNDFGNWQKIKERLEPYSSFFPYELKIIEFLKQNTNNFHGALTQIPEQIKLWVFAFASLLFNDKVSSYVELGKNPPKTIPLLLSDDKKDWKEYENILSKNNITNSVADNLKDFPFIQLKKRELNTKEKVEILNYKIINEGIILKFLLPKGAYATTFLSQLFNLTSGEPPKDIYNYPIDTKATLEKTH